MVSGFVHDPLYEWLYPEPAERAAQLRPGFELVLRSGLEHGVVEYTDGLDAVAIWTGPGVPLLGDDQMEAWLAQLRRDAPARFEAAVAGMAACGEHAPDEPHWMLHSIVVGADRQGRGIGSALLRSTLDTVDRSGVPAYLESSNPRNVTVYERVGFRVLAEVPLLDGPVMRPMLRPPEPR